MMTHLAPTLIAAIIKCVVPNITAGIQLQFAVELWQPCSGVHYFN